MSIKSKLFYQINVYLVLLLLSSGVLAQPNITPAAGFEWVMTGVASYTTALQQTTPNSATQGLDTSFGESGDSDPSNCASYCGGNCDGVPYIEDLVFGTSSLPQSSCEQRAVTINHWNNAFPESAVSNGATSGQVYLPTSASVNIDEVTTGAGGDENRAWIIGGNGGGNSVFNTRVDYSINWHVPAYGLSGGSGAQDFNFTWNWGEPGGGTEVETSGWNNFTTDGFGGSYSGSMTVPVASIVETGGTFEVIFEANSEITTIRLDGTADARTQHGPGMEGGANYVVEYEVWELQAIAVPVEYASVFAEADAKGVNINWETAQEVNSEAFVVERSDDGQHWRTLGEVPAAGHSVTSIAYQFRDDQPIDGINYYRLKQIDFDGTVHYSPIFQALYHLGQKSKVLLAPNPASDVVQIVGLSSEQASVKYDVVDLSGQIVQQGHLTQNGEILLDQLSPGIYHVLLDSSAGTQPLKLVKL